MQSRAGSLVKDMRKHEFSEGGEHRREQFPMGISPSLQLRTWFSKGYEDSRHNLGDQIRDL